MTKEKLVSLEKYIAGLKEKLASPVSEKRKNHVQQYHNFLNLEIKKTQSTINAHKDSALSSIPNKKQ